MYVIVCDDPALLRNSVLESIMNNKRDFKYLFGTSRFYYTNNLTMARKWKTENGVKRFLEHAIKKIEKSTNYYTPLKGYALKSHKLTDEEINKYIDDQIFKNKMDFEKKLYKLEFLRKKLLCK